jgi:hypothetical protein
MMQQIRENKGCGKSDNQANEKAKPTHFFEKIYHLVLCHNVLVSRTGPLTLKKQTAAFPVSAGLVCYKIFILDRQSMTLNHCVEVRFL